MLTAWALATLFLLLKILGILLGVQAALEIFKALRWIEPVVKFLDPFLRLLGLSRGVGLFWITGSAFGLVYGSALVLEEVKEGKLTKEELERLQVSLGLHHSAIEDPLLFMAFGLSFFWLWAPRFLVTILVTRLFGLWQDRRSFFARPASS